MEELHDRGPIGELQRRNRLQTTGRRLTIDQDDDYGPIAARSWRDRGAIVARSRPDRAENHAFFEAKLKLIPRGIEATTHVQGIVSTTLENRSTNASIGHDLRANFFFKTYVFLLLFFNFRSIREGIKQILRQIFSSS